MSSDKQIYEQDTRKTKGIGATCIVVLELDDCRHKLNYLFGCRISRKQHYPMRKWKPSSVYKFPLSTHRKSLLGKVMLSDSLPLRTSFDSQPTDRLSWWNTIYDLFGLIWGLFLSSIETPERPFHVTKSCDLCRQVVTSGRNPELEWIRIDGAVK